MKISIRHIIKVAEFLKGENTKIFEQKFSEDPPEKIKALADSFYLLFGEWEDHNRYRALVEEIGTIEAGEAFVKKCEEAVAGVKRKLISSGVGGHIGKAGPERAGRPVAENLALQYLWKYVDELKSGNPEFFSRLDRMINSSDAAVGDRMGGDLFEKIRGVLRKEKEGKSSIPELAGKEIKSLSKEEVAWVEARIADSKTGGEAHSADDLISLVKKFKPIGDSAGKKISEFGSYSEVSRWMDEKSFGNKAAYVDSISDAAQSDGMSEVIYEDERWKVVLIGSTIAGQWWGRDTDFCISGLEGNLYSSYAKEKNIDPYFIIDKLANSSDKMRKFTIAAKYKEDGSFEISKDSHTMTDATNIGISMEDIKRSLGESYEKILGEIKKNAGSRKQSAGKKNGKKLKEIIRSKDVIGIKKYEKEIAADEALSKEFLHNLNHIKNFENMRNLIINIINKNPYNFLKRLSGEDWTKEERPELNGISYIDIARMGYAKQGPTDFITNFSMEEWAMEKRAELGGKSCLDIAAEALQRTNPIYFLDYFSKKPWAKNYIYGAAEVYAKESPIDFLNRFSTEEWAAEERTEFGGKSYLDIASKAYVEEQPFLFIGYFAEKEWAEPHIGVAAKAYAEREPYRFLMKFSRKEWAKKARPELDGSSYLSIAAKTYAEKKPIAFLENFFEEPWAEPYINGAAEVYANQNPIDFLESFSEKTWAKEKRSELEGKSYVDLANEALSAKGLNQTASQANTKLLKLAGAIKKMSTGNISQEIVEFKKTGL